MTPRERIQYFQLPHPPTFTLEDGGTVTPTAARVRLSWQEDRLQSIRVRLHLSASDWATVERAGAFGLATIERGPTFGGEIDPAEAVILEAQLIGVHVAAVAALCEDATELAALFDNAALGRLVCKASSWVTRTVAQTRGELEVGFATRASGLLVRAA